LNSVPLKPANNPIISPTPISPRIPRPHTHLRYFFHHRLLRVPVPVDRGSFSDSVLVGNPINARDFPFHRALALALALTFLFPC
jgi:hypothetical protein